VSVIIYGHRAYGTVEAHGGEYAETRFFHIWFVPLVPTESWWITNNQGGGKLGHRIKMHGKSVLAGYLRVWGPGLALLGLGGAASGNPLLLLLSAAAIAATVAAWSWRNVRGETALRRSDFNLVAFGTRCEPRRMPSELRAGFKRALDSRWNAKKPDRTPDDIAQHGTKDANEAILAYGLLRLGAIARGRDGRTEDAAADRILAGSHSTLAVGDGPYREGFQEAPVGSLAGVVQELAAAHDKVERTTPEVRARDLNDRKRRSRKHLAGLVVLSMASVGGIAMFVQAVLPTRVVTIKELSSYKPPTGRTVRVTCESVEGPVWEETDSHGHATNRIAMCLLGRHLLPVRFDDDSAIPKTVVEGELKEVRETLIWVREGLRQDPQLEAATLDVYIDASHPHEKLVIGVFALAIALGTPVLWVLWFRARRRRLAEVAKL
jgi:hypothetical protein